MHNINLRDSYIVSLQDDKVVDVSTNEQHIIPDFGYQGMTEIVVRGYSESVQEKTVDSSTVEQEVTPDQGYTSMSKVTVNPYELDSSVVVITSNGRVNVTSEKDGLSSVDINVSVSPVLQYKEVDSSTNEQNVVADNQYQGLSQVKINPYELDSKTVDSSTNAQVIVSDKDGMSQVTVNPYVLDSSSATIEENGTYQFTSENDGLSSVTVDVSIDSRVPQSKTVDSSTNSQEVVPDEGYNALDKVTVNPYELDSKTVDSSTNSQTVVSSKDGLSQVTVNPYVLDSSSANINANGQYTFTPDHDGLSSVTVDVSVDSRVMETKTVDSSTNSQVIVPGEGYNSLGQVTVTPYTLDSSSSVITENGEYVFESSVDGLSRVDVSVNVQGGGGTLESKTVDSSTNSQVVEPEQGYYGLSQVTVNPYVLDSSTVDASTSQKVVTSEHDGLSSVTINAVTSSIDSNIQAGNIKKDVTILGVTGSYEGGSGPVVVDENDVNFIDYDGTILYSYTKSAFNNLSAMPENVSHISNFTGNSLNMSWNYDLASAKSEAQTLEDGERMYIGQNLDGQSWDSSMFLKINIPDASTKIGLYVSILNSNARWLLDWGDGTTEGDYTTASEPEHTYTNAGTYNVSFRMRQSWNGPLRVGYYGFIRLPGITDNGNKPIKAQYVEESELNNNLVRFYSDNGFNGSNCLKTLMVPKTATSMGNYTFYGNSSLKSISIPMSVTSLGTYCFASDYSLKSISIPMSVTSLGTYCFSTCYNIEHIHIPSSITSIPNNCFTNCINLKNVHLPSSITTIGNAVFYGDVKLESITIPSSVTSIGTFVIPYSVSDVYVYPSTPPTIGTMSTGYYSGTLNFKIHVPNGHLTDYQTASNWSAYASNMVEMPA